MGSLLFMTIEDMMTDFARDHDLHDFSIMVTSSMITASLKPRTASLSYVATGITYESKYDNIEFTLEIKPSAHLESLLYGNMYGTSNRNNQRKQIDAFVDGYNSQLIESEPYLTCCAIADMIINSDANVIILMTDSDVKEMPVFPETLNNFMEDEFHIFGYDYKELLKISKAFNDGKDEYDKMLKYLSYDVPEEFNGRNFEVIYNNSIDGDIDVVKKELEAKKIVAANLNAKPGRENDINSIFFNKFTEDLEEKLRELLLSKENEVLRNICRNRGVRVSPKSTKEFLVDKILHSMKIDSARVEYERN